MSPEDMLGQVATSSYTNRVMLALLLVALFALAADPAAADVNCNINEFDPECS